MKYKDSSDKELWERCQSQDDERAFAELFERYSPQMMYLATRYAKESMVAEELVMDCFFKLWDRRERTIIESKFATYLSRCVYHAVISHFDKEIPVMVGLEEVENTNPAEQTADNHILLDDMKQVYQAALEKLSPRRREVFMLSRHENLTYPEIAKKLNLTVGTVELHMVAALNGLRASMKNYRSVLILIFMALF